MLADHALDVATSVSIVGIWDIPASCQGDAPVDTPSVRHPSEQALSAFGLGKLDDRAAAAVSAHLKSCDSCRNRVAEMSDDSFLSLARQAQAREPGPGPAPDATSPSRSRQPAASAPPPASTMPPELAENPDYEIKKELGRGGMGVVFLAHNKLMGRDEVLKVMSRQIIEKPGVFDRFQREIRAVAKLQHPNIVTAYSAARLGESFVFAMEYVDGYDLSKLVKANGPLPVAMACVFVQQAALGIQHAHERGLVHRDIKPANLMLAKSGGKPIVKILYQKSGPGGSVSRQPDLRGPGAACWRARAVASGRAEPA